MRQVSCMSILQTLKRIERITVALNNIMLQTGRWANVYSLNNKFRINGGGYVCG